MGKVATKAMQIARGTALTLGVALMLALVLGVASTALAGTGVGARFDLGKTNTVNAMSKLVGSVAGSSLLIDNDSAAKGATALNLQVEGGRGPMKVNSGKKIAKLNADKLDNLNASAFVRSTYSKLESSTGSHAPEGQLSKTVSCDGDDFALSGGYSSVDAGTLITSSGPSSIENNPDGWVVRWRNDTTPDSISVMVLCADVGTPRQ